MRIRILERPLNARFYTDDIRPYTKHTLDYEVIGTNDEGLGDWAQTLIGVVKRFHQHPCEGTFDCYISNNGLAFEGDFWFYTPATAMAFHEIIESLYAQMFKYALFARRPFLFLLSYSVVTTSIQFVSSGITVPFSELDTEERPVIVPVSIPVSVQLPN